MTGVKGAREKLSPFGGDIFVEKQPKANTQKPTAI